VAGGNARQTRRHDFFCRADSTQSQGFLRPTRRNSNMTWRPGAGGVVRPGRDERKNGGSGRGGSGDTWKPAQRRGADQPKSMTPNAAHSRTRVAASQTPARRYRAILFQHRRVAFHTLWATADTARTQSRGRCLPIIRGWCWCLPAVETLRPRLASEDSGPILAVVRCRDICPLLSRFEHTSSCFVVTRHRWPHIFEDSHRPPPRTRVKIRFRLHDTWHTR